MTMVQRGRRHAGLHGRTRRAALHGRKRHAALHGRTRDAASHGRKGHAPFHGRTRDAGFTLVEVLVAVTVVAVALAAGMRAAGALTDNAQRLASVTAAQWCADNHLTGLKLARSFPGVGETEFECEQIGIAYKGKLTVVATPNPSFRRVNAQISDDAGTPIYSLSTILGRFR